MANSKGNNWVLRDGVWHDTVSSDSNGIVISDSVVMGDVIQNIILENPDHIIHAVREALDNLGFSAKGAHPTSISGEQEIQLQHTLTLADSITERGLELGGWTEISLGYACELKRDMNGARMHFERALRIAKRDPPEEQDTRLHRHAELGIAILEMELGNLNTAEKIAQELRLDFLQDNDTLGTSNAEEILGLIAYSRGNYQQAESYHSASLNMRESIGYEEGIANSKVNLGNVAMSQQKVDKASNLFSEAQSSDPSERDKAQLLCSRGVNEMQKGNVSRAIDLLNQSLKIRNKIKHSDGQTECYNYLGTAYMMQGRFDKGWDVCSKARDNADRDQDEGAKAHALFHMGQASVSMGNMSRGISELRLARGIFQNMRDREGTSNCDSMLRRLNPQTSACFIATAAYGTPYDSKIDVLRNWRDDSLKSSILGRMFIRNYYFFSPPIASIVAKSTALRGIVRLILSPIIHLLKTKYSRPRNSRS
jgi:tetratricopeptide (TPR) repeat protein